MSAIGRLIRDERVHQGRSQMDLALDVGVSTRHLSYVELGKSRPSREVVLLIADRLDVPLRRRNDWLMAAGYAPRYPETPLAGAELASVRRALQQLVDAHEPFPAVVIDRRWTVQLWNEASVRLAEGIPPHARGDPSNIFRISLHPDGFAPRTVNFTEWSSYLLRQLDIAVERTGDPELVALADEASRWPRIPPRREWSRLAPAAGPELVVPWRLRVGEGELSMFTTMSTFGTPVDVTLSELTIELFFAADANTERILRGVSGR